MKTVFDKSTRDELISRIKVLDENTKALWGKMNMYQMLKHCALWDEMIVHNKKHKRLLIGRLLGRLLLKKVIQEESLMRRNTPSIPELIITDNGEVSSQKMKWIAQMEAYAGYSHPFFMHPFFGKMTKEQIGYFAYKHADHHLKQFNG